MKNNATNVFSLCLLAISLAVPAASKAATPLVTQYIAPVGNPTWEARVMTGAYGTGGGIVFNQARTGDYYNYFAEISGNFYTAWCCFAKFTGSESISYPDTITRKVTSSPLYLYPAQCKVSSVGQGYEYDFSGNAKRSITCLISNVFSLDDEVKYAELDSQSAPSGTPSGNGSVSLTGCPSAAYVQKQHTDWVYAVKFNANTNGVINVMDDYVFTNSAALPACAYTKEGHSFKRWNTKADGSGVNYDDGSDVSEDLTLYAQWTAAGYTVTFSPNYEGGTVSPASKTVTYGKAYGSLPSPARSGYSFDGWYSEASGGSVVTAADIVVVPGDHVLYAHWKDLSLTVNFDANYEGGSVSPGSKTVTSDGTYGELPVPERTGYVFDGWYTAATGGSRVEANTHVVASAEHTLFAHWTAGRYSIRLDPCGGTLFSNEIELVYGEKPSVSPSAPWYSSGLTYLGYYTARDGGGVQYWDSVGNWIPGGAWTNIEVTVLYAYSAAVQLTVLFDANGGDCDTPDMQVEYGKSYGSLPTPIREKHTFLGWFTTRSDSGSEVTPETQVLTTSSPITLYAHWRDNTVGIRFDANGGKIDGASVTNVVGYYEIGEEYGLFPEATNANGQLFFAGWWTSTNPVDRVQVFETNIVDSATTNLYARWKAVAEVELCTLTFKLPDGSEYCKTNAAVGAEYGKYFPANPTHDGGYRFFGWYGNSGNRVSASDVIAGNATLTERWTLGAFNDTWNCPDIAFSTNGVSGWTIDAETGIAQSMELKAQDTPEQRTVLEARPDKPGRLAFEWKVSSIEMSGDKIALMFLQSSTEEPIDSLAGEEIESGDWHGVETDIAPQRQYSWTYWRAAWVTYENIDDCGWVRDLSFTPEATASTIDDWASVSSVTSAVPGAAWTTGGDKPWATTADADVAAAVDISDGRSSWVKLAVPARAGVLSFKWRTSGEAGYVDTNGVYQVCDYLEFFDENGEGLRIEGMSGDFAEVVWTNDVEAAHVFTWRYVKDGDVAEGEDGAWLRDVVWTPMGDDPEEPGVTVVDYEYEEGGEVKHGSVTVPNDWVDEYDLKAASGASDYLSALTSQSGKKGYGGADLCYWADYVAGTVPTNPASVFRVSEISVVDGTVRISWDPDWSDPAGPLVRQYTVWGKTNLTDSAWHTPTNSASRFFRVEVDLPKQ